MLKLLSLMMPLLIDFSILFLYFFLHFLIFYLFGKFSLGWIVWKKSIFLNDLNVVRAALRKRCSNLCALPRKRRTCPAYSYPPPASITQPSFLDSVPAAHPAPPHWRKMRAFFNYHLFSCCHCTSNVQDRPGGDYWWHENLTELLWADGKNDATPKNPLKYFYFCFPIKLTFFPPGGIFFFSLKKSIIQLDWFMLKACAQCINTYICLQIYFALRCSLKSKCSLLC